MKPLFLAAVFVLTACLHTPANGAVAWDESTSGDLSSDPESPTPVTFAVGSNIVGGTTIASDDTYDYLTFTIEPGQSLTNLLLMEFEDLTFGGNGNTAFHAIIEGSTSYVPDFINIQNFLGANHLDFLPTGTDVLPDLAGAPFGGTGFTIPLGPGTYTYHVQQVDTLLTGYSLDFVIEGEAEPESADFDNDGDVDGRDFLKWQRGESTSPLSAADLMLWQDQYGTSPLVATVGVPEPSTLLMATVFVLAGRGTLRRACSKFVDHKATSTKAGFCRVGR